MPESVPAPLAPWSSFYVMIGSSAAALTGLVFVVITIMRGGEAGHANRDGISVFTTPTVIHFCVALYVAAVLVAPWPTIADPAALLAVAGIYGIVHIVRVWFRARRFESYTPDLEDWTWYTILPLMAYASLLIAAFAMRQQTVPALFGAAFATVLLIFTGIRNAWDVVTYLAIGGLSQDDDD